MNFYKPKFWDKNKVSFFSIILFPIALLIKFLTLVKHLFTKEYRSSIPVICVGNIYLGGTSKTSFCIKLFDILKQLNRNPAFIKKKYTSFKDEFNLLKSVGPTFENYKRINALNEAAQNKSDIAILDDGFQDFSVKKNITIVCFNEKQWIGNGQTIPSGPLRESLSALNRANFVIINGKKNINIENKILKKNKDIKIFYIQYIAKNVANFINKKVICFAGIGNPTNFFDLLKNEKINLLDKISFPDHYNYSDVELENLIKKANNNDAILLTTEKDYFRIKESYKKNINYLKINIEIKNENQFVEEIKKII